jgi:hypothetical protein
MEVWGSFVVGASEQYGTDADALLRRPTGNGTPARPNALISPDLRVAELAQPKLEDWRKI